MSRDYQTGNHQSSDYQTGNHQLAPPAQTGAAGFRADRLAEAWLMAAAASGALFALTWLVMEVHPAVGLPGFPGSLLVVGAVPALLILAAYFLTAAFERRAGIREQRGALAALTGLAAFTFPFFLNLVFSPVYGLALILLAVRTRGAPAAALGAMALLSSLSMVWLPSLQAMPVVALVAAAGGVAAVRSWRAGVAGPPS